MNAERVRQLAGSALSGFLDLGFEDAVEMALWDLTEILKDVTDDPGSIALVARIEAGIRDKSLLCEHQRMHVSNG